MCVALILVGACGFLYNVSNNDAPVSVFSSYDGSIFGELHNKALLQSLLSQIAAYTVYRLALVIFSLTTPVTIVLNDREWHVGSILNPSKKIDISARFLAGDKLNTCLVISSLTSYPSASLWKSCVKFHDRHRSKRILRMFAISL